MTAVWPQKNLLTRLSCVHTRVTLVAGPSLADAGPGARYGVGPPSVRLQWRYGGGGGGGGGSIPFVAGRGARCDRTSCTAQRTALAGRFTHSSHSMGYAVKSNLCCCLCIHTIVSFCHAISFSVKSVLK